MSTPPRPLSGSAPFGVFRSPGPRSSPSSSCSSSPCPLLFPLPASRKASVFCHLPPITRPTRHQPTGPGRQSLTPQKVQKKYFFEVSAAVRNFRTWRKEGRGGRLSEYQGGLSSGVYPQPY